MSREPFAEYMASVKVTYSMWPTSSDASPANCPWCKMPIREGDTHGVLSDDAVACTFKAECIQPRRLGVINGMT